MPLLELAGAPADVIRAVARATGDDGDVCEVWEENWQSVMFFMDLGSQWRAVAGMAGFVYLGLDYAGVEAAMRMLGISRSDRQRLFQDVRRMEAEALPVRNAS